MSMKGRVGAQVLKITGDIPLGQYEITVLNSVRAEISMLGVCRKK